MGGAVGVYPGSFDPLTLAHLAVAEAAWRQGRLARIDLVVSRQPLGKDEATVPCLEDRLAVLREAAASRPWLGTRLSEKRLLVELAEGYDAVVMGADKWAQLNDPAWYGSPSGRDRALRRLVRVVVAPRPPHRLPAPAPSGRPVVEVISVPEDHGPVSSTLVRAGRPEWMAPEAAAFDALTGAWTDPDRYRSWRAARDAGR